MVETEPKLFLIQGDVYEVEKLVGVKTVKGQKLYRVRWRGYGRESDTLEPEENLLSCKDMIQELEKKIREKHEKKKFKKSFKTNILTKELRSSHRHGPLSTNPSKDIPWQTPFPENVRISKQLPTSCENNAHTEATWSAAEVLPSDHNLKDTFWRDFDEGKISVSGTVYDKDMYSKVKERAERGARTPNSLEGVKSGEGIPKEPPTPVCPKMVLKRKSVNRTESLTFKSTFKVKPLGMQVKKRKKYDVLRDYRRRRSRFHRKRNRLDENGRRKLSFKSEAHSTSESGASSSNILQELLINDETQGSMIPEFVTNGSKATNGLSMKPSSTDCPAVEEHNLPLVCRISIQDKSLALYSARKLPKIEVTESPSSQSSTSNTEIMARKVFSAMLEAIVNDRFEKIERYCSSNYIVNCSEENGTTPLMVAANLGRFKATQLLLKANAHKDRQNTKGETALMMACKNGFSQVAKLLLEHGANFALTNAEGINVLRILNQYSSQSDIHNLLIDHIVRVVSQFETAARCQVRHIAQIKHALFPIQCFSLNEGPRYSIYFHHHVKLESPEKNGHQNLLFIACAMIKTASVQCQFNAEPLVHYVSVNGVRQELFEANTSSVYKMTALRNGSNKVAITTAHHPQSEVKLVICAYKVHCSVFCFPTQKIKREK